MKVVLYEFHTVGNSKNIVKGYVIVLLADAGHSGSNKFGATNDRSRELYSPHI